MSELSHVSMAVHYCPYCQKNHPTGDIILDRRLKRSLQRETATGMSLCPSCKKVLEDQDGILIVGATRKGLNTRFDGSILGLKADAVRDILGEQYITESRIVFAEPEAVKLLISKLS